MIFLDDRVGSKELKYYFLPHEVTVTRLNYGDAYFMGNGPEGPVAVGLERKTVADLLGSLKSGRLQGRQIPGMSSTYNYGYVILEGQFRAHQATQVIECWSNGKWRALHGQQWKMGALVKLCNTLSMVCGFAVIRSDNERSTADCIRYLYQWWQQPWNEHRSYVGFRLQPTNTTHLVQPPSLFRCMVKELPGIGWERSLTVEEKFRTLDNLLHSTPEEWCSISGIGSATAKKIMGALKGLREGEEDVGPRS